MCSLKGVHSRDSLEEVDAGAGMVQTLLVVGQVTLKGVVLAPAPKHPISGVEGSLPTHRLRDRQCKCCGKFKWL